MIENTQPTGSATRDPLSAELLQSVVDVARAFFGAQASSLFLLDAEQHELVFQSVSGQGQGFLVGRRFPASNGIAGWVVATGESMVVDDLSRSPAFDRELAESTRYVPTSLMAVPMVHRDRILGVLEVLDPAPQSRSSLDELDLLALFARQAATALRIVVDRDRAAGSRAEAGLDLDVRAAAQQLIVNLQRLMGVAPA